MNKPVLLFFLIFLLLFGVSLTSENTERSLNDSTPNPQIKPVFFWKGARGATELIVTTFEGKIFSVDISNGEPNWLTNTGDTIISYDSSALQLDQVFIPSLSGHLYSYDKRNGIRWTHNNINGISENTPYSPGDGFLYLSNKTSNIIHYEPRQPNLQNNNNNAEGGFAQNNNNNENTNVEDKSQETGLLTLDADEDCPNYLIDNQLVISRTNYKIFAVSSKTKSSIWSVSYSTIDVQDEQKEINSEDLKYMNKLLISLSNGTLFLFDPIKQKPIWTKHFDSPIVSIHSVGFGRLSFELDYLDLKGDNFNNQNNEQILKFLRSAIIRKTNKDFSVSFVDNFNSIYVNNYENNIYVVSDPKVRTYLDIGYEIPQQNHFTNEVNLHNYDFSNNMHHQNSQNDKYYQKMKKNKNIHKHQKMEFLLDDDDLLIDEENYFPSRISDGYENEDHTHGNHKEESSKYLIQFENSNEDYKNCDFDVDQNWTCLVGFHQISSIQKFNFNPDFNSIDTQINDPDGLINNLKKSEMLHWSITIIMSLITLIRYKDNLFNFWKKINYKKSAGKKNENNGKELANKNKSQIGNNGNNDSIRKNNLDHDHDEGNVNEKEKEKENEKKKKRENGNGNDKEEVNDKDKEGEKDQGKDRQKQKQNGGIKIGNIWISNEILGYGSDGTVVYKGKFGERDVAVKRMLVNFFSVASIEIKTLMKSDQHPNVIQYYSHEKTEEFVYLTLQYCPYTLNEIIEESASQEMMNKFFTQDNIATKSLYQFLHQMADGMVFLHDLRIVHRDLKPQNILVDQNGIPKITDFSLCKNLKEGEKSFSNSERAVGTKGWQSKEVLLKKRVNTKIDVFALGCVFHYILTKGKHPFGQNYEREINIRNEKPDLSSLIQMSEAYDLISWMIESDPNKRPTMKEVQKHPMFWDANQKLNFLLNASDVLEFEQNNSPLIQAFEKNGHRIFGENWMDYFDELFLSQLQIYRNYNGSSLRDLLRIIRNKKNHYKEMSKELKLEIGSIPDGFLNYFLSQFPGLFIYIYHFSRLKLRKEALLIQYW
ncbi:serine/threonine-protein kinase/endoribonuclease ire1 [Anaeramoeba flamelloides]|uniref:non-specific serine/threonine protein kinase n=1 Tax=Anaeramoeba flamelloides TaxID=1746091 RepID=A0AAV7YQ01_9EUKA|nr:serine/threonine-protein kinase/endoribonuclease ire1 [Anaeramoeba flamelloides]